jgi:hypothetical protein
VAQAWKGNSWYDILVSDLSAQMQAVLDYLRKHDVEIQDQNTSKPNVVVLTLKLSTDELQFLKVRSSFLAHYDPAAIANYLDQHVIIASIRRGDAELIDILKS